MFVKFVYWLAVLVISLALVVALVLFFESRDQSAIDEGDAQIERESKSPSGPHGA